MLVGFELTQKILRNRLPITSLEKLLLVMIADRIDHKGYCYPSVSRLAWESGMSSRQVTRCIKSLDGIFLSVKKISGKNSEYRILEGVIDDSILKSKEPEGGDSLSGVVVTDSQGGSDSQSGEGCQAVTLINKTTNNTKDNLNKAKSKDFAKTPPSMNIEVGEKTEDIKHALDYLGQAFNLTKKPQVKNSAVQTSSMINILAGFPVATQMEDDPFIYHFHYALDTLKEGEVYNILCENVSMKIIHHAKNVMDKMGWKYDYIAGKDSYIKIGKPKKMHPHSHHITMPTMSQVNANIEKTISEDASLSLGVPAHMIGYDLGSKPDHHVHVAYTKNDHGEIMDVSDVEKFVATGKTTLKPAKVTAITLWRDTVIEWRDENDVKGDPLDFGQKEAGILNKAQKKYGDDFYLCLRYAVMNWKKYVTYANMNTGCKSKPAQPDFYYFVKYLDNAKLFLNSKSDTKVKFKQPTKLKITKKVLKNTKTQQLLQAAKEKTDES